MRLVYTCWFVAVLLNFIAVELRGSDLATTFRNPPASSRPWVFWFWLNGNITSNGITADLEAMQRVGIGGVAIMDVDQGVPKGPITFGSKAWYDLFTYMCTEAHRLGLEVNMNNDAGWSGSGGPWITPELSMQKLVWSETAMKGPMRFTGALRQPETVRGYYRDISVIAFPSTSNATGDMADNSPRLTTSVMREGYDQARMLDHDPTTGIDLPRPEAGKEQFVRIDFPKPYQARRLVMALPGLTSHKMCHGLIEVSDDGEQFRTIREFDAESATLSYNFAPTTARCFRIRFTSSEPYLEKLSIAEVELSQESRIDNFEEKALFVPKKEYPDTNDYAMFRSNTGIPVAVVTNISSSMDRQGNLVWDVPEGTWTVLRFGHTSTGEDNQPAPETGRGLECDKLNKAAAKSMFDGLIGKIATAVGPLTGKTFVAAHVDSWEVGAQNWTGKFREEFRRLRGYDPVPYLPATTGRVIGSLEVSERFLWDLRQTVSELLVDNYAGALRDLAHQHGMRLTMEAYDLNPCQDLVFAGRVDEPMAEFWTSPPYGVAYSCLEMTSAAHVYGKPIVGGEACTATEVEKWTGHPYAMKVFCDWAYCHGINRMVLHRYALQPWTIDGRTPGMCMGPWGQHYERTQTWWEQTKPWHEYLSRCQSLLQQGQFVADICYLAPEEAPYRWQVPGKSRERPGYNFDGCPPEIALNHMSVKRGRIALDSGMSYRVLALPQSVTMTPKMLGKIKDFVLAGATVVGPKPMRSPSLEDYPKCDEEVNQLTSELWGATNENTKAQHSLGKGKVIWNKTPQAVLSEEGVPFDFAAETETNPESIRYIHKVIGDTDVYFLANKYAQCEQATCRFRITNEAPEFWHPETGEIEKPALYDVENGLMRVPIRFDPFGSVFVVFRKSEKAQSGRIVSVHRAEELTRPDVTNAVTLPGETDADLATNFTFAVWAKPDIDIEMPEEINQGLIGLRVIRNDALYPPPGEDVYTEPRQAGCGISIGLNGVCIFEHTANHFAATLVAPAKITNWTHVAVVYRDGRPSLYLNGRLARQGVSSQFSVHSGVGVKHKRGVAPFRGEIGRFKQFAKVMNEQEVQDLMQKTDVPTFPSMDPDIFLLREKPGSIQMIAWRAGSYVAQIAGGKSIEFEVASLPVPFHIEGPWTVEFQVGKGAPPQASFDGLDSWSEREEPGIRYYSGAATYKKTFQVPQDAFSKGMHTWLSLGEVAVIAEPRLNGKSLGDLWKPPFQVDVTDKLHSGENKLEVTVVNLWPNRMIGDEQLPDDSPRKADGMMEEWPQWILNGERSPTGRQAFETWRPWKKDSPLQRSGLLGPVRLLFSRTTLLKE